MKRPRRKSDRKTTRQEKARSTRGDEPGKGNRRKRDRGGRSQEPKDRKAGRQESQREEHEGGIVGSKRWPRRGEYESDTRRRRLPKE